MSKPIIILIAIIVLGALGWYAFSQKPSPTPAPVVTSAPQTSVPAQGEVKEFVMQSWYSPEDKRPYFSLNEMAVNKGDRVRLKVTNTFGTHDFTIDEYGLKQETPVNQETVIEFTADKTGEFVYYCSKPNHRSLVQWGVLRVLAD